MIALPSSIKNEKLGEFFINKKIISQTPIYLMKTKFKHADNTFYYRISTYFNKENENSNLVIKLKSGIKFFIDDIISYCYNEGGVYTYDCWVIFLKKITKDDILEMIGDTSMLEEIYNPNKNSFDMEKINKNTYCNLNQLINYNDLHDIKYKNKYKDIYEYQSNKKSLHVSEKVEFDKDEALNTYSLLSKNQNIIPCCDELLENLQNISLNKYHEKDSNFRFKKIDKIDNVFTSYDDRLKKYSKTNILKWIYIGCIILICISLICLPFLYMYKNYVIVFIIISTFIFITYILAKIKNESFKTMLLYYANNLHRFL